MDRKPPIAHLLAVILVVAVFAWPMLTSPPDAADAPQDGATPGAKSPGYELPKSGGFQAVELPWRAIEPVDFESSAEQRPAFTLNMHPPAAAAPLERLPSTSHELVIVNQHCAEEPAAQRSFSPNEGWRPSRRGDGPAAPPAAAPVLQPPPATPAADSWTPREPILERLPPVAAAVAPAIETAVESPKSVVPQSVVAAIDMEAAVRQADRLLEQGKSLAERPAFYSVRVEFRRALSVVAQALDAPHGRHAAELETAFVALREAEDFWKQRPGTAERVRQIAIVHDTPVLKHRAFENATSLTAMKAYFRYAQEQLVKALREEPQSSHALYSLGKLHKAMAEDDAMHRNLHGPQAMVFHQAALLVNPSHHRAANELGVMLAAYGQWSDAKRVLQQGLAAQSSVESWHNLTVVHEKLGETELARLSRYEWSLAVGQRQRTSARRSVAERDENGVLRWVDNQTFAGIPNHMAPPAMAAVATPQAAASPATVQEARSNASPWWTPWKN